MSEEQNVQSGGVTEAHLSAQLAQMSAQEIVQSAADALPVAEQPAPAVTHESLLTELVGAVKKCARGVSHEIEDLIAKAEKHFGL
ncbi:hypothetical protein [Ralstonia pseudosolanacearum]|uniref:hypothetical protein n=1 Tax=Ralstonia pseudosolanacearum TaxID=1310165 RepID=UPI0011C4132F